MSLLATGSDITMPTYGGSSGRGERLIEIVAVLLLGLTTIGTAWCAFQATMWNGQSGQAAQAASTGHVEAAREFGLATQQIAYDSTMTAQYAQAVAAGDTRLQQFYRTTLVRPDFLPTLDAWQAWPSRSGRRGAPRPTSPAPRSA